MNPNLKLSAQLSPLCASQPQLYYCFFFFSFSIHQMVPWLHRTPRLNKALGCLFYGAAAFPSGFLNTVGGKQGGRNSRKKSHRKRRGYKKSGSKRNRGCQRKLSKAFSLCHHLAILYLSNLSAAVWKVKGKWAQILKKVCLDPAAVSVVHRFWWLPWVQMEGSDESMLTACVTARRREWRTQPGGPGSQYALFSEKCGVLSGGCGGLRGACEHSHSSADT